MQYDKINTTTQTRRTEGTWFFVVMVLSYVTALVGYAELMMMIVYLIRGFLCVCLYGFKIRYSRPWWMSSKTDSIIQKVITRNYECQVLSTAMHFVTSLAFWTASSLSHEQIINCVCNRDQQYFVSNSNKFNASFYSLPSKLWQCDTLGQCKRLLKTHLFGDHGSLWHFLVKSAV